MSKLALPPQPLQTFISVSHFPSRSQQFPLFVLQNQACSSIPICRCRYRSDSTPHSATPQSFASAFNNYKKKKKKRKFASFIVRASYRESPYQVLGVSPSATPDEIKRAYRKLALKYHPDVNKEAGSQERFMRIKHAYNTLVNSESRRKYDYGNHASDFSYSGQSSSDQNAAEEFYGFGDFLRDLQEEFLNWEASISSQGKPKSLWEELALRLKPTSRDLSTAETTLVSLEHFLGKVTDRYTCLKFNLWQEIGEEFVEFLEKELNISDSEVEAGKTDDMHQKDYSVRSNGKEYTANGNKNDAGGKSSIDNDIDEIEATLNQLKKELGL